MEGTVYHKARQEWDERYADPVLGKRNWQIAVGGRLKQIILGKMGTAAETGEKWAISGHSNRRVEASDTVSV